ncbi:hypothetical protein JX266_012425 [Neoarthrinium moseri]|nr:hypothetical protein JX266_012425 [Neoarthrinium moseri]
MKPEMNGSSRPGDKANKDRVQDGRATKSSKKASGYAASSKKRAKNRHLVPPEYLESFDTLTAAELGELCRELDLDIRGGKYECWLRLYEEGVFGSESDVKRPGSASGSDSEEGDEPMPPEDISLPPAPAPKPPAPVHPCKIAPSLPRRRVWKVPAPPGRPPIVMPKNPRAREEDLIGPWVEKAPARKIPAPLCPGRAPIIRPKNPRAREEDLIGPWVEKAPARKIPAPLCPGRAPIIRPKNPRAREEDLIDPWVEKAPARKRPASPRGTAPKPKGPLAPEDRAPGGPRGPKRKKIQPQYYYIPIYYLNMDCADIMAQFPELAEILLSARFPPRDDRPLNDFLEFHPQIRRKLAVLSQEEGLPFPDDAERNPWLPKGFPDAIFMDIMDVVPVLWDLWQEWEDDENAPSLWENTEGTVRTFSPSLVHELTFFDVVAEYPAWLVLLEEAIHDDKSPLGLQEPDDLHFLQDNIAGSGIEDGMESDDNESAGEWEQDEEEQDEGQDDEGEDDEGVDEEGEDQWGREEEDEEEEEEEEDEEEAGDEEAGDEEAGDAEEGDEEEGDEEEGDEEEVDEEEGDEEEGDEEEGDEEEGDEEEEKEEGDEEEGEEEYDQVMEEVMEDVGCAGDDDGEEDTEAEAGCQGCS